MVEYGSTGVRHDSFELEFVRSEAFDALFQEGMELIEETSAYLQGPGRVEQSRLSRDQALAYTGESIQLAERLTQIASWLSVQKALAEGSLSRPEALRKRERLSNAVPQTTPIELFDSLPGPFRELVGLTARLYTRIQYVEDLLFAAEDNQPENYNPVAEQHSLIERAFLRRNN